MEYTSDELGSETSLWTTSKETEKCEKQRQWSELPSLPLERIYSFLKRRDQVNMSLVCRAWSKGYSSPSVWKTFRFTLENSQLSMVACPVMKFVQKYNSMFRHVKVYIEFSLKKSLVKTFCRHFLAFLQILTYNATQLISVEFHNVSYCLRLIDSIAYHDICLAIANFLGSQHQLKRVEFHRSYFEFQEGVELLRKLTENSGKSLKHLVLRGFVRYIPINQEQDSIFAQNLPTIADLPNLTTLDVDYSLIFENMFTRQYTTFQTVKNCNTLELSKIILNCQNAMTQIENLRGLTSTHWRFLKLLCPHLQVELTVGTYVPSRQELEFLIVPNMPITRLEYRQDGSNIGNRVETDILFGVLLTCKINDHLASLCIQWDYSVTDLVTLFIPFLSACKKLKSLELFILYPTNIADLMEYWLDNPPECLENVNIYISLIRKEDYTILINLTFQYMSRLKLRGLNVKFNGYIELND